MYFALAPSFSSAQEVCTPSFVASNADQIPSGFDISAETQWLEIIEQSLGCVVDGQNFQSSEWPMQLSIEGGPMGTYGGLFIDAANGNAVAAFRLDPNAIDWNFDGAPVAFYSIDALSASESSWTLNSITSPTISTEEFAFSGMRFFPYEGLPENDEISVNNAIAASLVLTQVSRFAFSSIPTGATVFVANDTFLTDRIRGYRDNQIQQVRMTLDGFDDCIIMPDQFGEDWRNGQRIVHCAFGD